MRPEPRNFIEEFVCQDIDAGKTEKIVTRFPPEPNGYLHIGHAKAFSIDFEIARRYGGVCNMRFDDTNPVKEDPHYVDAILDDIRWMGYEWSELHYASEYFDLYYQYAMQLVEAGLAYVDDLSGEEIRQYRGTLTEPGRNSPFRSRPAAENRSLFERMRAGEFPDGSRVLRAKIDMASPNMNMRDPVIYRIKHASHHQSGDKWCIYPMYDFAHPLGDAIEGITHSLCSQEFENHRPLYDWFIEKIGFARPPRQIEFARLNITGTIMSKRYLRQLVESKQVGGWDDPRMPTLRGLRRRGYTPTAILDFLGRVGVAKADSTVDVALLEACIRDELNQTAPRAMAVLRPLKVIIENYPQGKTEYFQMPNHPDHQEMGSHQTTFSREIYIEQDDFMIDAPTKFFRLKPGGDVRLKGAYIIHCDRVECDAQGQPQTLYCCYDPDSYTGGPTAGRKVKGTIHWVDAATAAPAQVRLYQSLLRPDDDAQAELLHRLNPQSLEVIGNALIEPWLTGRNVQERFQFVRSGYFSVDPDSRQEAMVFNRIVGLRDTWAKVAARD